MTEYGIRLDSGRVIVGPDWRCVADVVASIHGHDLPNAVDHGRLVKRETDAAPWLEVAS